MKSFMLKLMRILILIFAFAIGLAMGAGVLASSADPVQLDYPKSGQIISSPLEIVGRARGNWFFEASFPVMLVDWDGKIIAQGIATAKSDWMTKDFVPFEAKITFQSPYKQGDADFMGKGALILQKDNPSGLPEFDDAIEVPIAFTQIEQVNVVLPQENSAYSWYLQLIKPSWAPPAWLFGPVWTALYIIIVITFGAVFFKAFTNKIAWIIVLPFALNLIFNFAFTPLQFGLQNNILATLDILLVLATLVWAIVAILPFAKWIAFANIPYLFWVCFATVLQITITYLN